MKRFRINDLEKWILAENRKPLIIRGARQVGKTWLVRNFAEQEQRQLIELNLERQPNLASLITNDPSQTLLNLSAAFNQVITPEHSLLFIDEIQVVPELLSKLRWFAEDLPTLPVIAAGSLLDFALSDHSFSMPVGRISYFYLEPLSFDEFLLAQGKTQLQQFLTEYQLDTVVPAAIHAELTRIFKEYLLIGGLPAAVQSWISERSLISVNQVHHDLLMTYRNDFAKYKRRITELYLDQVMMAVPKMLSHKFVYSHVDHSMSVHAVKNALNLLQHAKLCHPVHCCSANGIPIESEIKIKYFKEIFMDVGLSCLALGLTLNQINEASEIILINKGGIAEQVVGQILRTMLPYYIEPRLYYWQREEKGSSAEIDYILQHNNQIIPLEVKSGSTGGLKSLHLFMSLKELSLAIRINSDLPTKTDIATKNHQGKDVQYTLISLPFYLLSQAHRLLNSETMQ